MCDSADLDLKVADLERASRAFYLHGLSFGQYIQLTNGALNTCQADVTGEHLDFTGRHGQTHALLDYGKASG